MSLAPHRGPLTCALPVALVLIGMGPWIAAQKPVFEQAAPRTGLDFRHFNGMTGQLYFPEMVGAGVALFDMDNDGDLDVYLGQGNRLDSSPEHILLTDSRYPLPTSDRLYRNELISEGGNGSLLFTDVTDSAGLPTDGYNMGVIAGDLDNDGFVDLYVSNLGSNHLLHNDGDGTFTNVIEAAQADDPRWTVATSLLDYDRDGDLDIFVGNYVGFRSALHKDCTSSTGAVDYCGPLSYVAHENRLLRNIGGGRFERATTKALAGNPAAPTLGTVVGDFNSDGWLDLYVANDQTPNHLWLNQGDGTFVDDARLAGAAVDSRGQPQASMGVVAGDFTGDGHEDLFMTHLRMEMNMLYVNDGTGLFSDRALPSGLGRTSFSFTGFGAALFDYDNDSEYDLYIANGAVKRLSGQVRQGVALPLRQTNQLFRGMGDGRFEEVPATQRVDEGHSEVSRGVAVGDVDNDGDADLVITNNSGPARLLLNRIGSERHWVGIRLVLAGSGRNALGARAELAAPDGRKIVRRVRTDGSYASSADPRLLFGLGSSPATESLTVAWPDGTVEHFGSDRLRAGEYVTLEQGSSTERPTR